jgi:tetratricopeptide (TPR) repeat protein
VVHKQGMMIQRTDTKFSAKTKLAEKARFFGQFGFAALFHYTVAYSCCSSTEVIFFGVGFVCTVDFEVVYSGSMSNCCVNSVRGDVQIDMLNDSRYGEYEILLRNLAEANEAEFGLSDPKTLKTLNLLAVVVGRKRRFAESESIYRQTIEICKRVEKEQGDNAIYDTCKSTAENNLGCLLISKQNSDDPFQLLIDARALGGKVCGETTAHSHDIVQNQANYEFMKGHYLLAADLYRDSLRRKLLSATSPNIRNCECERSLADSLYRAGNFVDAEAHYRHLLTELDLAGVGRISRSQCRNRLASTLLRQEKLEEAEAVLRDSLSIAESEANLDTTESSNASALNIIKLKSKIAAILLKQKKYEFAEKMYTEALPANLPEIYDALAQCLILQGKLAEATQFYTTVLQRRESDLGVDHPQTIHAVCAFGDLYTRSGNLTLALDSYQRVLTVYEREIGPDNVLTLTAVENVGFTFDKMKRLPEAESMLSRALAGFEKILGNVAFGFYFLKLNMLTASPYSRNE